jgi:hypothetical protein
LGGYAVKQSADFALFKEVREKLSKPILEKPKSTLFFFCLLLFGSSYILLFLQFAANCLCQKKKEGRSHLFLQFNHLLFGPEESIFFSNSITLFLVPKDASSSPPSQSLFGVPREDAFLFSNSNHFFGSQGRMHFCSPTQITFLGLNG